jgi:nitrite reductase (NADH) large subunit
MKKIVAIGNSVAAVRALEEIRRRDKESEMTLFCEESRLPYNRFLFGDLLTKTVTEDKIFYKAAGFYKEQNILTILGKRIARVDFKKNRITTEEKEQVPFDTLLIANTGHELFPNVKGTSKMGVFGLCRLGDIKDILSILHLVDVAVVQANTIDGLKVAEGLRAKNKDVVLVIPSPQFLSGILDAETAETIVKYLEENGVRVIRGSSIAEILGEGEVKAVRLNTGKVLASQMVIFGDTTPDLRLFNDSPLEKREGILTDEYFRTSMEGVFAVDAVFLPRASLPVSFMTLSELEEQGRVAGLNILGETTAFVRPSLEVYFKVFQWTVGPAGITKAAEEAPEQASPQPVAPEA